MQTGSFSDLLPERLGIDVRALAVLRVALGTLILVDLALRSRFLAAHLSDNGVLPRESVAASQNPWHFSLHLASGEPWVQAALFLLAALLAVSLILGFHTRLATVASWLLLVSLHVRAPELLHGGDTLLRLLLFWAMFLPLGAAWSVDRALQSSGPAPPRRCVSMGTAALLLQVVFVYVFSAIFKLHPVWVVEGRAVQYALMVEQLATPLAVPLLEFEGLMRLATYATVLLEFLGPLVAVSSLASDRVRFGIVLAFVGLHLSFMPFLTLGLFPLISLAAWIPFVPSHVWDRLEGWIRRPEGASALIHYDGDCGFCTKAVLLLRTFLLLGHVPVRAAQRDPEVHQEMTRRRSWLVDTHDGRRLMGFQALTYLVSLSGAFGWLAHALRFGPVSRAGERLYRWIAGNRAFGATILAPFSRRRMSWTPRTATNILALLLLGYVAAWNVVSLGPSHAVPAEFRWLGHVLRLEQEWTMFAPYPITRSGHLVALGALESGERVELGPTGTPLESSPEATLVDAGIGLLRADSDYLERIRRARASSGFYRWRKFHEHVADDERLGRDYATFLCSAHARRHPDGPAIDRVALHLDHRRVDHSSQDWEPRVREKLIEVPCETRSGEDRTGSY